ncbi:MAG: L,D-transpeptidase [Anaerolineae bacterium]|jgi:lipoprotein-anchoring transpeptidase ErfK/SrfK
MKDSKGTPSLLIVAIALCMLIILAFGALWAFSENPTAIALAFSVNSSTATETATTTPIPSPTPTIKPSPIPTWTPTFTPTPTRGPALTVPTANAADESETRPSPTPPDPFFYGRWIDVDLTRQMLTAYQGEEVARTTLVSTGKEKTPTPTGLFHIHTKLRYDDMRGPDYYLPNVPYVMYFYKGYALHGTYWHTNFGQTASHGCINLPTPEAEWLYNWVAVGTPVNIHE